MPRSIQKYFLLIIIILFSLSSLFAQNYITIGSKAKVVLRIMGSPAIVKKFGPSMETWYYGLSNITFRHGLAYAWNNCSGNLPVVLGRQNPKAPPIKMSDKMARVTSVLGTPTVIQRSPDSTIEIWLYEFSSITFRNGVVDEWDNCSGNLKISIGRQRPNALPIKKGAKYNHVIAAMGTPAAIKKDYRSGEETWFYDRSSITFKKGKVRKWQNASGNLKVIFEKR